MSDSTEAKPDRNRDSIATSAQACLDHVRRVRWGTGSVGYDVDDGDIRINVTIQVSGLGLARKEK